MNTLITQIKTIIEADTVLSGAVFLIDINKVTNTGLDKKFTVDIQTKNSNKSRDRSVLRLEHAIIISFAKEINLSNSSLTQDEALIIEEDVLKAMLTQLNLPEYSVFFVSSIRNLNQSSEYIITKMIFNVSQSYQY